MTTQVKRKSEMLGKSRRKCSLVLLYLFLANPMAFVLADGLDREVLLKNKINRINVVMQEKKLHAFHQSLTSDETDEGFFADSVAEKRRNNQDKDRQAEPILKNIPAYDYIGNTVQALRSRLSRGVFSSNLKIKLLDSSPALKAGEPVLRIDYLFDKDFSALNIQAEVEFKNRSSAGNYKKIFLSRFKAWPETTKPEIGDNIKYWQNNPEFLKSQLSLGIAEIAQLIYADFNAALPERDKWTAVTFQSAYETYKQAQIISEEKGRVFLVKRRNKVEVIQAMVDVAFLSKRREKQKSAFFNGFRKNNSDDDE